MRGHTNSDLCLRSSLKVPTGGEMKMGNENGTPFCQSGTLLLGIGSRDHADASQRVAISDSIVGECSSSRCRDLA